MLSFCSRLLSFISLDYLPFNVVYWEIDQLLQGGVAEVLFGLINLL